MTRSSRVGVPPQQKVPHFMVALQHPEALLGEPAQLHAVTMERPVQQPALPRGGERPILSDRALQMQTKDIHQVQPTRQGAQPPLRGRAGLLPAAGRDLARLPIHPLIAPNVYFQMSWHTK
jgi:hypothetical protein